MRAGFAEADVTPNIGVHLAGYPGRNEPSEGVEDPLYLRVVALEDDAGGRMVLVTGDLLKFPRDMAWRTKLWCEKELGLASESVIINLSHTHSAPGLFVQRCYPQWPVDVEYLCRFEQAIRDGIRGSLADLRTAEIRYGLHEAHFGVSRRLPQAELGGRVRMAAYEEGYYDPEMPVLAVHRDGELSAVLYSYACHPTSMASLNISADWPGQVSQALRAELGENVVTLFAQGAGASIMPRVRLADGADEYRAYWAAVGKDLADFVQSTAMREIELSLRAAEKEFHIPYDLALVPSEDELLALASPEETPVPDALRPANRSILRIWARDTLEQVRTGTLPEGFRMHLTRVGLCEGLQILAMSGEVTAEVGRMCKDLFAGTGTIFFGYCSYTDAYIPTAAMLPEGGHEGLASLYFHERPAPFVKEIDGIIKRETAELQI